MRLTLDAVWGILRGTQEIIQVAASFPFSLPPSRPCIPLAPSLFIPPVLLCVAAERETRREGRRESSEGMIAASRSTFYIIPRERACNETVKRVFRVTRSNNVSSARETVLFLLSI